MEHPNILYIFGDQHRYSALGCNGNEIIKTPNFDRLSKEGITCDQAFSCHPLCSPYRGNLLTGTFGWKNLVVDNEYKMRDGQRTIAHVLKEAGYRTGFVGKWHLGYGPYPEEKRHGFDWLAAYDCYRKHYEGAFYENEEGPIPFNCWSPERETSLALDFIKGHIETSPGKPFALMLGWSPPHWPYEDYPQEFNIYDPGKIDIPGNVPEQFEDFARKESAHYYGCITALDNLLGQILQSLEDWGISDNTIVCYSSDHGDHLSSHGYGKPFDDWMHPSRRASKATPYDESIHVPFILRFPNEVKADTRSSALLSSVDIMPTLLDLCGIPIPQEVQGLSLSHIMRGQKGPQRQAVYLMNMGPGWPPRIHWTGNWRALRTDRWLFARWYQDEQGPWLIDRESDPLEMENLAGHPDYTKIQENLERRLKQFMEETEDPFESGERDPVTNMLKLGQAFDKNEWYDKQASFRNF